MISYRKIGGIHWIRIGRLRFTWMIVTQKQEVKGITLSQYQAQLLVAKTPPPLHTYTNEEHNHFIF